MAIVIAGVLALLVGLFVWTDPGGDPESESAVLGHRVPSIAGTTLDGEPYNIDNQRGRWVLVNFFATWCPTCVTEHPDLVELEDWGAETDSLRLVSIVFDDDPDEVAALFEQLGGSWPVLDSPSAAIDFQVRRVPESYLVNPDGVVVAQVVSGVDADWVKAQVTRP